MEILVFQQHRAGLIHQHHQLSIQQQQKFSEQYGINVPVYCALAIEFPEIGQS